MFVSGAITLTRPKYHATSGALATVAMVDMSATAAIVARQPSSFAHHFFARMPPAIRLAMPNTLSW